MNKQILSFLLLTSFVGTMSASSTALSTIVKPFGLSIWAPNFILVAANSFGAKAGAFMGKAGAKFAGLSLTAQEAILTVPLVGSPIGMVAGFAAVNDHFVAKAAAAKLAARPWYTRAGSAVAGYASAAKVSASKGVQAVVASVKLHPKSAIAAGVVGTAAVSYLAYRLYNGSSSSISLNEQERANLRVALRRADTLGKQVFHNPSVTTPVRLEEVFATESTGLPKKAVDVLNKHVALSRKLSDIAAIQTTRALSPNDLAIQKELKDLDAQLLATLPIAAAA